MHKRKILFSLESRATYGYSRNVMRRMLQYDDLEIATLVTGGHLSDDCGNSIELIRDDGFPISGTVKFEASSSLRSSWSAAMGQAIIGYSECLESINPDFLLLFGDRIETLALCIAASYMNVPIAHVQAGDKSGHIDDRARYAIAKFAHLHFASCDDSANRVLNLGEQPFRVFNTGAPQLDDLNKVFPLTSHYELLPSDFIPELPYILLVFHPIMNDVDDLRHQVDAVLESCLNQNKQIIWIYPNNDLGYDQIIDQIHHYSKKPNVFAYKNINRDFYMALMSNAFCLVGNSSSGILEAPSFNTPVINIGTRQRGRLQAVNIINSEPTSSSLARSFDQINDESFQYSLRDCQNPYGDGNSSERICNILRDTPIDLELLDKITTY